MKKGTHTSAWRFIWALCLVGMVIFTNASFRSTPASAASGINQQLNYQGRLYTASGATVPDGYYNIQFKIYQDGAGTAAGNPGGTLKWTENWLNSGSNGVQVVNGFVSVQLGTVTPFASNVDWNQDTLWLSMNIGNTSSCTIATSFAVDCAGDGEMVPMKRLSSTPYALNAGMLGGKTASGFIQNGTSPQTSTSFNIDGTGTAATLQAATFDTAAAGILTIGGTNASSITLADNVSLSAGLSLTLVGGATGTRPASPTEGMVYYDTTTKQLLTYANGKWQADKSDAILVAASDSSDADKAAADYVADGTADQTEINNALTAADPAGSGRKTGKVYLFAGTYSANATILIPNNVTLSGSGQKTVIQLADIDTTDNLIENSDTTTGTGITIRDLRLEGQRNLNTAGTQNGIYLLGMGKETSGNDAVNGAYITNVTAYYFRTDGLRLDTSSHNTVTGNIFRDNAQYGLYILNVNSKFNSITANVSEGNNVDGYRLEAGYSNVFTGNVAYDNASAGFAIAGSANSNNITNNNFRGNNTYGIYVGGSTLNNINANNIRGGSTYGIYVSGSDGNTFSDNNIYDTGSTTNNNAIYLLGSDRNNITNNVIDDTEASSTNYAINISDAGSSSNYLSGNILGVTSVGSLASTINNAGTDTVYGGQATGADSTDILFKQAASAQAFQIQGSTGTSMFTADTSANNKIQIGSTTTDATAILFGLDSYNNGTDPAGFNGAMYYNTNTNKFRCYQNGAWADCVASASNFIQNQNAGQQTSANFWIQGSARSDTSVLTPTLDTATTVALNIGTTGTPTTTQININQNTVLAAGKTIRITGGNTASRPAITTEGVMYYDTDTHQLLTSKYNSDTSSYQWKADGSEAVLVAANDSSAADKAAADYIADGTADQTEINYALTAADPTSGTRKTGKVYLFAGTYTTSDVISIRNNTTLAGAGRGTLIQFGNIAGQTKNMITNYDTSTGEGVTIRDLRLDGNKAVNTTGTMYGIYMNNVGSGSTASARQGATVINTWVMNFISTGIFYQTSSNGSILNNTVQGNSLDGVNIDSSNRVNVSNNVIMGNNAWGVHVSGALSIVVNGNNIASNGALAGSNASGGIVFDGTSQNNAITNNAFRDNGTGTGASNATVYFSNASNNTVTGNVIADATGTTGYAIFVYNSSSTSNYFANNAITGTYSTVTQDNGTNTIWGGQLTGVNGTGAFLIQNAGGTTISGGAINMNVSSNFAINIGTGTTNAAVSIGNSANTTNLASRTINIGTVGATNTIQGITQTTNNTTGDQLTIKGSAGLGSGNGGTLLLSGGDAGTTGVMGLINLNPTAFTGISQNCTVASCSITTATVNANSTALINNTYSGSIVTLADPTILTAGRVLYVTNSGTQDMTLSVNGGGTGNTIALKPNTTATMFWNGTDWTAAGASSATDLQAAYNNTQSTAGGAELVLNPVGGAADGLTIRNNGTTPISGGLFEIQTSIGTNLFSVNSFGTELAANGGAETAGGSSTTFPANTWTNQLGTTVARTTTAGQYQTGQAGVSVATNSVNLGGVRNQLTANPVASTYTVSFTAASSTAGENTTTIEVFYSPDGGTTVSNRCTGFGDSQTNTRTISNNTNYNWTKVTCTVTATVPTGTPLLIIRQTDATNRTLYIDNLSFIRNDSTTRPANVQMGGGNTGGQVTLFTLDRSSTAPLVSNGDNRYIGSMYYDTTLGNIQCYEADGWGACGSAPDNIVILTPEYSNAVLNGTGVGTMTADFCSNESGVLQVNTTFCANHVSRNYYRWTSPQASDQTYSIYVSYKLPVVFKQFYDDNTIKLTGYKDHATNGQVTLSVFRSNGSTITQCGSSTTVTTGTSAWNTTNLGGTGESSCGFLASETVIFKIDVMAKNNANVYVENLEFRYTNK